MKTNLRSCIGGLAFASALIFNLSPCGVRAQGSLTPPGPPGPTMRTLQQVEPRTPIGSAPFTITQPGSYYLTTNLTVSTGDAIVIATNGVTLDLSGFTISSTASPAAGAAILINSGLSDIAIVNGHIRGGVTNNGGVYGGPGFGDGIGYSGTAPRNVRVSGINVSGCFDDGIYVDLGNSTLVEGCMVRTVGGVGIFGGAVKRSEAVECGGTAIFGTTVSDCLGQSTGSGTGVYADTALNCRGYSSSGNGVFAWTAQNCLGVSADGRGVVGYSLLNCWGQSSSDTGLTAENADNCGGQSFGGGRGINALRVAQNCYGYSSSGDGLTAGYAALNCYGYSGGSVAGIGISAITALNCYGYSNSASPGVSASHAANCRGYSPGGYGLWSLTAQGCYGQSNSSFGIYAWRAALNCYGESASGSAGLYAQNAAFCVGSRPGGTAVWASLANGCWAAAGTNLITYKFNMP